MYSFACKMCKVRLVFSILHIENVFVKSKVSSEIYLEYFIETNLTENCVIYNVAFWMKLNYFVYLRIIIIMLYIFNLMQPQGSGICVEL